MAANAGLTAEVEALRVVILAAGREPADAADPTLWQLALAAFKQSRIAQDAVARAAEDVPEGSAPPGPDAGQIDGWWGCDAGGGDESLDGGKDVFHVALLAPHFCCLALTLNIVRVQTTGVFDFDHGFPPILVFHEKIGDVSPTMLLAVDPGNGDTVTFHPLDDVRVALQAVHHPSL